MISVLGYDNLKRKNEELKRLSGELTLTTPLQKVEIVRRVQIKSVCAAALEINCNNIYRPLKQSAKDQALKQPIKAIHRDYPAYGHRRMAMYLGSNHKRSQRVTAKFNLQPLR